MLEKLDKGGTCFQGLRRCQGIPVSKGPLLSTALNSTNYVTDKAIVTELTEKTPKRPQYMQSTVAFSAEKRGSISLQTI